jgi:hypothetical protein
MNRKVLSMVLAFALLMLFPAVAPVFAAPPTRGTFNQVVVQVGVTPPDKAFVTDHINHESGSYSASYIYGAPWGNSIEGTGGTQITSMLNLETFTGMALIKTDSTYAAGTTTGTVNVKFNGFGMYTYTGDTFTFDLPGLSGTITNGESHIGILLTGLAVKHGVSGDLKGLEATERGAGVMIFEGGPLDGVVIFETTVTYKLSG